MLCIFYQKVLHAEKKMGKRQAKTYDQWQELLIHFIHERSSKLQISLVL